MFWSMEVSQRECARVWRRKTIMLTLSPLLCTVLDFFFFFSFYRVKFSDIVSFKANLRYTAVYLSSDCTREILKTSFIVLTGLFCYLHYKLLNVFTFLSLFYHLCII